MFSETQIGFVDEIKISGKSCFLTFRQSWNGFLSWSLSTFDSGATFENKLLAWWFWGFVFNDLFNYFHCCQFSFRDFCMKGWKFFEVGFCEGSSGNETEDSEDNDDFHFRRSLLDDCLKTWLLMQSVCEESILKFCFYTKILQQKIHSSAPQCPPFSVSSLAPSSKSALNVSSTTLEEDIYDDNNLNENYVRLNCL